MKNYLTSGSVIKIWDQERFDLPVISRSSHVVANMIIIEGLHGR